MFSFSKVLLLALVLALLNPILAHAKPIAQLVVGNVSVTLYNTECVPRLKRVTNLPYRIQYKEQDKVVEGCYGLVPEAGAVLVYFEDKDSAIYPLAAFRPLTSM